MAASSPLSADQKCSQSAIAYFDSCPTPFHLCKETGQRLEQAGFVRLREDDSWESTIKPGGKFYYTRNGSSLVAFTVGAQFSADGSGGFKIVGAHTDSPVLKVKPVSARSKHGYIQVGVETYGGGLWHTWFDRELSVAGRVIVKEGGGFKARLVKVERPICRVPNLCIHLQSGDERASFKVNKENHLSPILAQTAQQLNIEVSDGDKTDSRHAPELLRILAEELSCSPEDIQDFELTLFDVQGGQLWGAKQEFLSSPRLDNQIHCYTSTEALIKHAENLSDDRDVSMIALFDHEEVGSQSAVGACSPIVKEAMGRISASFRENGSIGGEMKGEDELYGRLLAKSFMISADVAHAIHPNYSHKHEENHQAVLNRGTVIKTNSNQRYATNSISGFFCRELARIGGIDVQEFVVRQDCPCGTTIGPILSANTGLRTVDVGVPSLSMHSIRETMGVKDVQNSITLFEVFFKSFRGLDDSLDTSGF